MQTYVRADSLTLDWSECYYLGDEQAFGTISREYRNARTVEKTIYPDAADRDRRPQPRGHAPGALGHHQRAFVTYPLFVRRGCGAASCCRVDSDRSMPAAPSRRGCQCSGLKPVAGNQHLHAVTGWFIPAPSRLKKRRPSRMQEMSLLPWNCSSTMFPASQCIKARPIRCQNWTMTPSI